jgi:hypothetical protein
MISATRSSAPKASKEYKVVVKPAVLALAVALHLLTPFASQAPAAAQKQTPAAAAANFTAKSANVREPGTPVKINILRWSTDQERISLIASMDPNRPPTRGRGARGGRGRGLDSNDPAFADVVGVGRGGRGDAPPAPPNPIANLTAAINSSPTVGYIWTNEVVGYSIKYAFHAPLPDGGERIILATDRRLGAYNSAWKPAGSTPTDYEFTVVEMRLDPKGLGEGKTSLTAKVAVDNDAKTIALETYSTTPATLQSVKRREA